MAKTYDPQKAHEYYVNHRELKGRKKGSGPDPTHPKQPKQLDPAAQQKVAEIQAKLGRLRELLQQKIAAAGPSNTPEKKPTQADKLKDRQNSKEYYDKHKQQISNLKKGGGSGGSSGSAPKTAADMSITELKTAIRNTVVQLKQAIQAAQRGG